MESYEKKYKDALERARAFELPEYKAIVNSIFPELKESEDERMIKFIKKQLFTIKKTTENYELDAKLTKAFAWLEKQGNRPKKVSIWKHWKDGIAGNGDGEPIYLTKVGNIYSLTSCLGFECDYIELSELDNLMLEKQDEQKTLEPIEFDSTEDERIRKALISVLTSDFEKDTAIDGITVEEIVAWLEKQGETFTKKDVDDAYLKGISLAKNEIEKQYEADYQIRKDIATFIFNYRGDIKDRAKWMNYLGIKVSLVEKQGEKPQGKSALDAIKEEEVDNANKIEPKDYNNIDPYFGKHLKYNPHAPSITEHQVITSVESHGISPEEYNKMVNECIYGKQKGGEK